jgi:hypothetical protein
MISFIYTSDYRNESPEPHSSAETKSEHNSDAEAGESEEDVVTTEEQATPEPVNSVPEDDAISDRLEYQPTLFSSVRVYAIAEKYDIPPLRELARQRFLDWASSNWACDDFPAIVREVFDSTHASDRGLREVVLELVAKHADSFLERDDFLRTIADDAELGLGLFRRLVITQSCERGALMSQIEYLENDQAKIESQLRDCQKELQAKSKELDSAVETIKGLVDCKSCGSQFNLSVAEGWDGILNYTCRRCPRGQ